MRERPLEPPLLFSARDEDAEGLDASAFDDVPFLLDPVESAVARPLPSKDALLEGARRLADALAENLGKPVRLYVTDNRSTMISFRRLPNQVTLRVHHMFLESPPKVVTAIADYAGRGLRRAGEAIDAFVRANTVAIRPGSGTSPNVELLAEGQFWNLREIFDALNVRYFDDQIVASIGWGRSVLKGRRRSIRMGVYDHLTRTIRIHPALDRPEVPAFFVEYIVFHEMLHQAVPAKESCGRQRHHGPEFRAREKQFERYREALAWERENLGLLLGRPGGMRARPVD